MNTWIRLAAAFFAVNAWATSPSFNPGAPSSVTLPMQEFLNLKQQTEAPPVRNIEQAILRGQYGKNLSLELTGSSAKKWDKRTIAVYNEHVSLHDCKGDAVLDREGNDLVLIPRAERFKVICDVAVDNWASLELTLLNTLYFRSDVSGGQTITQNSGDNSRRITIVQESPMQRTIAADVSAIGRYHLTQFPDEIKFAYQFILTNPGRSVRTFEISFPNAEKIQQIVTDQVYTEKGFGLSLQLKPGENVVWVKGKYAAEAFTPVLPSEQQYLVVESHPRLQLEMKATAKRISVNDSGIAPNYRNAVAYLFGKNAKFEWKSKKLELLESLGFTVENANYYYYVPERGNSIVEATFRIQNQGTPEIPLKVEGIPTYVEIDSQPEPLYTDANGQLLLRLAAGTHSVLVQYKTKHQHRGLATAFSSPLVRPDTVLSNVSLSIGTPEKWRLFYGSSLFDPQSDFGYDGIFLGLVMFALLFGISRWAKAGKRSTWLVASTGLLLTFLSPGLFGWFLTATLLATLVHFRFVVWRWVTHLTRKTVGWVMLGGVGVAVIFFVFLVAINTGGRSSRNRHMEKELSQSYDGYRPPAPMASMGAPKGKLSRGQEELEDVEGGAEPAMAQVEGDGEVGGDGYVGMPARIKVPYAARQIAFHQELMDRNSPVVAKAFFFSQGMLQLLMLLISIGGLYGFYSDKKHFLHWLKLDR